MPSRKQSAQDDYDAKQDPQSFAFVLSELIAEKGYKSSKALALRIHVHFTLVDAWRRGDRVPEYASDNPRLTAEALQLTDDERKRLVAAHYYSRQRLEKARGLDSSSTARIGDIIDPPPPPVDSPVPVHLPDSITRQTLPPHPHVIVGQEELAIAATAMLHQAAQRPPDGPIYLTFYSPDTALTKDVKLSQWWRHAVREALKNGWSIVHLLPQNPNVDQLIGLVESIRSYLVFRGTYTPYYLKQYGALSVPSGVYSVPSVGTLNLFAVNQTEQVDAALYLTDPHQTRLLRRHVEHLLDRWTGLASPLALRYSGSHDAAAPIYDALLEADKKVGKTTSGRFLLDRGLSPLTRPDSFYDDSDPDASRFLATPYFSPQEKEQRKDWWYQTQAAFEQFVPQKRYRDVCPMSTILKLIEKREYGLEAEDLVGERPVIAIPQQVHDHLANVVRLLETSPNYELALLDPDEEERYLPQETTFWEVYPDQLVLLEYWFDQDRQPQLPRWLDVLMHEPTIVKAFSLYADRVWNGISHTHRQREFVLLWLNDQLRRLIERYPGEIQEKK